MSDPNWFQALGALMGILELIRCHRCSNGIAETSINRKASDLGLYILGGKGSRCSTRTARSIAYRIVMDCQVLTLRNQLDSLAVSTTTLYRTARLYQQYFLLSDEGEWTAYLRV